MVPSIWQIFLILIIILILFGAGKLPSVVKELFKSIKKFDSSFKEDK